ncbi:myoglobin isoform X3 [Erpetoichthys calabaricus]|uniref:myoglobin isoform X3 n=1 Tax=Erpetoichthys calabaricus TaxID=27687 RepID=UPI0022348D7D|nr:myoglobin isoform X3 [Erpetoichthys calabaricus]
MAMSEGEWNLVLKGWAKVESDPAGVGQAVLLRFFKDHPEGKSHFPKFEHLSLAELQTYAGVRTHGEAVVNLLTKMFSTRGKHASLLKPMAEEHCKTLKIPVKYFEMISDVIVKVMAEKIADFGADGQAAVRKALKVFTTDIGIFYES